MGTCKFVLHLFVALPMLAACATGGAHAPSRTSSSADIISMMNCASSSRHPATFRPKEYAGALCSDVTLSGWWNSSTWSSNGALVLRVGGDSSKNQGQGFANRFTRSQMDGAQNSFAGYLTYTGLWCHGTYPVVGHFEANQLVLLLDGGDCGVGTFELADSVRGFEGPYRFGRDRGWAVLRLPQ